MSVRSVTFMRNVIIGKGLIPSIRPAVRLPLRPTSNHLIPKKPATITSRFYVTSPAGKQQQKSKISSMASSPNIIQAAKTEPKPSKLKELTRKYGAVGIIVYVAVGCVDLGITLGVIQLAGLDKVKALERSVIDTIYDVGERMGLKKKNEQPLILVTDGDNNTLLTAASSDETGLIHSTDDTPSFASVFILAYGIHKTLFLPVRIGITAAITPAVVRKLHQMGWARYFPKLLGATKPKNL